MLTLTLNWSNPAASCNIAKLFPPHFVQFCRVNSGTQRQTDLGNSVEGRNLRCGGQIAAVRKGNKDRGSTRGEGERGQGCGGVIVPWGNHVRVTLGKSSK